jgi:branched-chain amino acid transport system ATP-binding protein
VSLTLRPGEIHALIGPNGAGKSTLIKQICGGLRPDAGSIFLMGRGRDQAHARPGAAPGWGGPSRSRPSRWRTRCCRTRCSARSARRARPGGSWPGLGDRPALSGPEEALERVGLAGPRPRTAELSHGERRQLEVAVALTLRPRRS